MLRLKIFSGIYAIFFKWNELSTMLREMVAIHESKRDLIFFIYGNHLKCANKQKEDEEYEEE